MPVQTKNISKRQLIDNELPKESTAHLKTVALRAYSGQKTKSVENERITRLLPMVHKIVHRVVAYLKPPLSFEDLVSAGTVGLVKAARDYDPAHQAEFKTYAYIRIRGAILDELRGWSFVPANLNKKVHKALELSRKIVEQTGNTPSDDQLAEKLGMTTQQLYETFENARAKHFISMDAHAHDNPALGNILASVETATPDQQIEKTELIDKLAEAIHQLPQRKRRIILLYYQQHLTMKQIAQIFKITEPRVSQLHASALFNLSVKLRQWKDAG